jgi:hypothetical protein
MERGAVLCDTPEIGNLQLWSVVSVSRDELVALG